AEGGRVMVRRRSRLYGLELESRAVAYGRIDPRHATEIFIREGLVNDTVTFPLDFLSHNRTVREKIEDLLTRARDSSYLNLDEAAYRFYAARLLPGADGAPAEGVSAVGELVALVRERRGAEPRFLMMEAADLRDPATVEHDATAFPAALPLSTRVLPLNYAYRPGQADDGVTLEVGVGEAEALTPAALDWAVPGHLEAKVEHHLRVLPKELRRAFVPLAETARALAEKVAARDRLTDRRESLVEALAVVISETHGIALDAAVWAGKPPPDHLRVRVRVVDGAGRELAASRDLAEIRSALLSRSLAASVTVAREEPAAWRAARARWETPAHTTWAFDGLPDRVLVTEQAGAPVYAFPGLQAAPEGVARRLFRTPEEAVKATRRGLEALFETQLGRDLMWTQRDLRALRELGPLTATLAPVADLEVQAFESIRRWVTGRSVEPAAAETFEVVLGRARTDLRGIVPRLGDLLREILSLRLQLQVAADAPPAVARHLAALLPADFLRVTPFPLLAHFPRYLMAMRLRAERARRGPATDAERESQAVSLEDAWRKLPREADPVEASRLRWHLEEVRGSLFAQELGPAEPVSALKLERRIAELRFAAPRTAAPAVAPTAVKPIVAVAAKPSGAKSAPVKSLGALDKLLGHPRS
ncbi:MAG: DUF3418 domain-containing protein, partial [Opitutaceae bacterium]